MINVVEKIKIINNVNLLCIEKYGMKLCNFNKLKNGFKIVEM